MVIYAISRYQSQVYSCSQTGQISFKLVWSNKFDAAWALSNKIDQANLIDQTRKMSVWSDKKKIWSNKKRLFDQIKAGPRRVKFPSNLFDQMTHLLLQTNLMHLTQQKNVCLIKQNESLINLTAIWSSGSSLTWPAEIWPSGTSLWCE